MRGKKDELSSFWIKETRKAWKLNARGEKKKKDLWLHPGLFIKTAIQIIRTVGTFSYDVYVAAYNLFLTNAPSITGFRI